RYFCNTFGALWLERGLSACVKRSGLSFTYYVARDYPFVKNKNRTRLDLTGRRGGWPGQAPTVTVLGEPAMPGSNPGMTGVWWGRAGWAGRVGCEEAASEPASEPSMANDTDIEASRIVADLRRELALRTAERDEALAQLSASAEVLQVINASP